jgi:hypothetical protein
MINTEAFCVEVNLNGSCAENFNPKLRLLQLYGACKLLWAGSIFEII